MKKIIKTILITGCSSGIGYRVAHDLHAMGYRVFATARNANDVERLVSEGLEALQLDVTDTQSMDKALDAILSRTGGTLDALVITSYSIHYTKLYEETCQRFWRI